MNYLRLSFCVLMIVVCIVSTATAQEAPNFAPGQILCANDLPITGNNFASATEVTDWNADGKKDLMVGVYYNGNIWLYLNQGTDEEPVFTEGALLEADGVPIRVGFG